MDPCPQTPEFIGSPDPRAPSSPLLITASSIFLVLLFLLSASSMVAQLPWDPSASSFLLNHVNTQLFNYFIWSSQKLCKMGSGDSFTCCWCCNWEEIARPCCNCRTWTSFHDKGVERALSQASDSLYAWHTRVRSEAGFFWSDLSWPIQLGKQSSTGILRKTAHLSPVCTKPEWYHEGSMEFYLTGGVALSELLPHSKPVSLWRGRNNYIVSCREE